MTPQENISLASFTTLGIGGPARWFVRAETENEVADAVEFARSRDLRLLVLGGGSNLLVADEGFPGVVLHMAVSGIAAGPDGVVRAAGGESWDLLVQFTVEHDLQGMECLAGIPGTVGGTPVQNVGAYGQEVSETICTVRCFDRQTGEFAELSNEDCSFAYRTSVLNTTDRDRYIVTRVDFALRPGGAPCLRYADLRTHFSRKPAPTLADTADAVRSIRRGKSMVIDLSDPNTRSAGSFFRNPIVSENLLRRAANVTGVPLDEVPHWPAGEGMVKLPAAWLLEKAGFVRGYAMGAVGISTKHTLALVNRGGATAADIITLRDHIIAAVEGKFGVTLEQEPVTVS